MWNYVDKGDKDSIMELILQNIPSHMWQAGPLIRRYLSLRQISHLKSLFLKQRSLQMMRKIIHQIVSNRTKDRVSVFLVFYPCRKDRDSKNDQ